MNNNFDQFYNQTAPAVKNAAYYRARAREVLKPCYWYAFLAAFVAGILGGVSSGSVSVSFGNFNLDSEKISPETAESLLQMLQNRDFSALFERIPFLPIIMGVVVATALFSWAFSVFVSSPVKLGYQRYCLNVVDGKGMDISVLFQYFKQAYGKSIGLNILYGLISWVCSIPTLCASLFSAYGITKGYLMIIAGRQAYEGIGWILLSSVLIIAAIIFGVLISVWVTYRFYFCYMIMAEYPEIGVVGALRNSATLMKGNKWKLFCLELSFIGWILAACCTCGIGMLFLTPYMTASFAVFYDDIANRKAAKETEFPSINPDDYMTE